MTPQPSQTAVLGLDNVSLELPIAGAATRSLAAFLDYLLVSLGLVAWLIVCVALGAAGPKLGWWAAVPLVIGAFLIEYGYFALSEVLREGRTFGKWALGLRVVSREGGRPATSAYLVRNAVRTVDLVVGVPLMASDPLARRLGDRLANTLVVHVRPPVKETILYHTPQGFSANEAALLEDFLRRADDMDAWRAEKLARQLLDVIAHDDPQLFAQVDPLAPPVDALRRSLTAAGT